ncbi:hypothetical protein H8356DRAFT_1436701 [Neocallimastix lanati (nom. inval.)]|nr:hypothetical protein H8356DRAFT_1436701 [Neocallimastix sp. JGI-2020a]
MVSENNIITAGNDIDEKRLNYLDIIRENTNHNKKEILCRIVFCGKVNLYDNLSEEEKTKITQQDLGDDEMSDEHIDETVFNLVSNLVSFGEILSSITKDEIKIALEELGTKHSNLIPSATQLDQFMKPNIDIISLYEWNTIFSPDYGLVLESELTWPEPESLIF